MRPKAIVTFEWLVIASVLLSLLNIFVLSPGNAGDAGLEAVGAVVTLALALAASRMRSNVARWLLTVLTVLGVLGLGYFLATGGVGGAGGLVGLAITGLQVAAVAQLFQRQAGDWFAGRNTAAAQ